MIADICIYIAPGIFSGGLLLYAGVNKLLKSDGVAIN